MKKADLEKLLDVLGIVWNEGITAIDKTKIFPRIDIWCIAWEYIRSSGTGYKDTHTYQISFYSKIPNDPKLWELRGLFADEGILPLIRHEFVDKDRIWHSFFEIDVLNE